MLGMGKGKLERGIQGEWRSTPLCCHFPPSTKFQLQDLALRNKNPAIKDLEASRGCRHTETQLILICVRLMKA